MLLLDTCAALWLASEEDFLSETAKKEIRQHAQNLFISSISALEIGIKFYKGRLSLPKPPKAWFREFLEMHQVEEIVVDYQIASDASALPRIHNDPADRIIVATAMLEGLAIVSPDPLIAKYPKVKTVW